MEERMELSGYDDDADAAADVVVDGNAERNLRFAFDLNFQVEIFRFNRYKGRLRGLFDQVLIAFLRDKCSNKCIRPIPVLCSDGRPVDLFKLFWLVWKIGGYDTVSRNYLWGFVCEECGLGLRVIASTKLIYMKYLNELDLWLQNMFSKRVLGDDFSGFIQKLDLLSRELEVRYRGSLLGVQKQEESVEDIKFMECAKDRAGITLDINGSELHASPNEGSRELVENAAEEEEWLCCGNNHSQLSSGRVGEKTVKEVNGFSKGQIDADSKNYFNEDSGDIVASAIKIIEKVIDKVLNSRESIAATAADDGERVPVEDSSIVSLSAKKVVMKIITKTLDHSEKATDNEERFSAQQSLDDVITSRTDLENLLDSRKRKRESQSYSGLLSWLIHVAKHPDDPSVGSIPECSKWSDHKNKEFWVQALLVRKALLIKRHANKNADEALPKDQQKKPKLQPSMYEDDVVYHQSTEKLRFSKRVPLKKSHLCPCCNSCAAPQNKDAIHREASAVSPKGPSESVATQLGNPPSNQNIHEPSDELAEKEVSVGSLFQAEVPEWIGVPSESDPKWLGTRMWTPEDGGGNSTIKFGPIGKGRHRLCNCPFPDYVACVRFHVAEKRLKLKQELGSLFYRWRFDRMGEEVSLSWTEEEEKIFKDSMRSSALLSNKLRNNTCMFLPSKTREKLVSYYFNVYLVQRRSYQNRVTQKDVDSDDDEKDCGSIGGRFGYNALAVPGSMAISCTLNEQCTELV